MNYLAKNEACTPEDTCRTCTPGGGCSAVEKYSKVRVCVCVCVCVCEHGLTGCVCDHLALKYSFTYCERCVGCMSTW